MGLTFDVCDTAGIKNPTCLISTFMNRPLIAIFWLSMHSVELLIQAEDLNEQVRNCFLERYYPISHEWCTITPCTYHVLQEISQIEQVVPTIKYVSAQIYHIINGKFKINYEFIYFIICNTVLNVQVISKSVYIRNWYNWANMYQILY